MKRPILIILLIVAAGAAAYIYREWNRTNTDIATASAAYTLTADDLIKEFEKNDSAASKKFVGKVILVSGSLKNISSDERGYFTLSLGDNSSMSSVRCSIDSMFTNDARSLKAGTLVKVKGNCTGFNADELLGSDVILNRCLIENK